MEVESSSDYVVPVIASPLIDELKARQAKRNIQVFMEQDEVEQKPIRNRRSQVVSFQEDPDLADSQRLGLQEGKFNPICTSS